MLYQGDVIGYADAFLADMERYEALGITQVSLTPTAYENPVRWATQLVKDVVPRLNLV